MDSEDELVILAGLIYCRLKNKKKKRRMWEHPVVKERKEKSQFYTLFIRTIESDDEKFFNYLRMSKNSFNELVSLIKGDISKKNTVMRRSIPAKEKIVITLRYLAIGCSFADLHYSFRIGRSTASKIINEVCGALWNRLASIVMPNMTTEKWLEIAKGFEDIANFPHCIGAIDGKHIRLNKPSNSGTMFYNYKNYFSMVLFAMCDSNYLFTFIDVGSYGKSSDSGIFKNSRLYEKIVNKSLNIPAPTALKNDLTTEYPFAIVGDEAFPLSENLLRPYGGKNLSQEKRIFNYRLSRARRYIECSFGILANKWRIFHKPLNVDIELAEKIIKAACVLHNFVRQKDGNRNDDVISEIRMNDISNDGKSRANPKAHDVRDKFANYFSNISPLEWQDRYI